MIRSELRVKPLKLSKRNFKMELSIILACLIALPALSLSIKTKLNPRIIQTRYGRIQGFVQSFEPTKFLKPIDVYLGIPYATPPVGGNRFSPTRAPSPWDGIRLSDSVGPVCPQKIPDITNEQEALEKMPKGKLEYLKRLVPYLRNQSEDCLYLNIYAPAMGPPDRPGSSIVDTQRCSSRTFQEAKGKEGHFIVQSKLYGGGKFSVQNCRAGLTDKGRRHPVFLYVHGESYDFGSGNPYDGSVLASYADQVVVTINYRLGILGFLNANVVPHLKARVANYGLMDQIAALHWVQQHIDLFGGDPGNVTLVGHGTGAACVNFLAISPTVMSGLFNRAILLSGSALSSWAVVEEPVSYALKLARACNCSIPEDLAKDNEQIVDCLREASLEELQQIEIQAPTFLSAFGPSVDGVVIKPDFQEDLLSYLGPDFQGFGQKLKRTEHGAPITSNSKYDLLFGVTTSEALWNFAEKDVQQGFEGEKRDRIIRTYVRNAYTYHLTEIFYTVVNEYTDWERTVQHPVNTRDACVQALSDAQFVAPLVQTGDIFTLRHLKKPNNPHVAPVPENEKEPMPKTYFYVFDYQQKDGDYPQRMGSVHSDELPYVFGAPLVEGFGHFPQNYTKTDVALSESIIMYFANFIRAGNPNGNDHHGRGEKTSLANKERNKYRGMIWDQYDPVHQKYLEFGTKPRMKNHYRAHQLSVWLRLVPELHRAGMEDVEPRHNLFRGHTDPTLYDGSVRPVPLGRTGEEFKRINLTTESPTTTDFSITTCVSLIQSTNLQNVNNASTDTLASLDAAGYAAYSTALSVTIAIGCSLLILNVLIFAGVYYQRDKTRLEVKSLQQQQMMNQQCGPRGFNELKQPPPPHSHFPGSGQVIVDVENEMLRRNAMKAPPSSPNSQLLHQSQVIHTLPHQHHYQKQHHQQHQGHATLPRASVIPEMNMSVQMQGPPNGSIHLTIPRAPPPPRTRSPPESQPLFQNATVSNRVPQTAMSEMRV